MKKGAKAAGLKPVLKVDEAEVRARLSEVVRQSVEETLNGMLDAIRTEKSGKHAQ